MKKRTIHKVSIALFTLAAVMAGLVSFTVTAYAQTLFKGIIYALSEDIDVSGIGITVYGSTLVSSKYNIDRYDHSFSEEVPTAESGSFSFVKPSKRVLLQVDLGTLPYGTGITYETLFCSGSGLSDMKGKLAAGRIDDIKVVMNGDGMTYNVELYDKEGVRLFADYTVKESYYADRDDINYDVLEDVKLYRKVTVKAGGKTKKTTLEYDIRRLTVKAKLELFVEKGVISEELSEVIYAEYLEDNTPPEYEVPEYRDERYVTSGSFKMHYENGLENVEEYKRVLDDVVSIYFGQYAFPEPYHEFLPGSGARDPYYHIYLVDSDYFTKNVRHPEKKILGKSKFIDPEDVTKGGYLLVIPSDDINKMKKLISHEIFHGIIYRYTGKRIGSWFSEAFANFGSMLCLDESLYHLDSQVKCYLNSTEYSLSDTNSYKSRHYGISLLPLYIHNKLGGMKAIKNILKEYTEAKNAYDAIARGLKKTNSKYTFAKAFCGLANYLAYDRFFKSPYSGDNIDFGIDAERTRTEDFGGSDVMFVSGTTLPGSSVRYYEFTATSDKSKLDITIDTSKHSDVACYNLIIRDGSIKIPAQKTSAQLMTYEIKDFSRSGVKSAVLTSINAYEGVTSPMEFKISAVKRAA